MSICPICHGQLKKKIKNQESDSLSVCEETFNCQRCKRFKSEIIGSNKTTWIGKHEFYGFIIPETKSDKYKICIITTKFTYIFELFYIFLKKLHKSIDNH